MEAVILMKTSTVIARSQVANLAYYTSNEVCIHMFDQTEVFHMQKQGRPHANVLPGSKHRSSV